MPKEVWAVMDQCPVFSKHWGSTQAHQNDWKTFWLLQRCLQLLNSGWRLRTPRRSESSWLILSLINDLHLSRKNITARGNVPKSTKPDQEKYPVNIKCLLNICYLLYSAGGALAACPLHLCCLWLRHLPNYPEHTNGVVQLCVDNNSKFFPTLLWLNIFPTFSPLSDTA